MHTNDVAYELRADNDNRRDIRAHYTQLRAWYNSPQYLREHAYYRRVSSSQGPQATAPPADECELAREGNSRRPAPIIFKSFSSLTDEDPSEIETSDESLEELQLLSPLAIKALHRPLL